LNPPPAGSGEPGGRTRPARKPRLRRAKPVSEAVSLDYFSIQRAIIERYTEGFVGRAQVAEALSRFQNRYKRGYFLIRGLPGQGKTAVACHLIRSGGLVHHIIRKGIQSDDEMVLRSLLEQLWPEASGRPQLPGSVSKLTKALQDRLVQTASGGERVALVIDGLDELPESEPTDLPYLVTEGLPDGVYFVVTVRPGDRFDQLRDALRAMGVRHEALDLEPLSRVEIDGILRAHWPSLSAVEIDRIAEVAQGDALYLRGVIDELERAPDLDLVRLPAEIEGFYRLATGHIRERLNAALSDVLGLLAVARKPLTVGELSEITSRPQREVVEHGIKPIRQFLLEMPGGFCFYHARFHEFVTRTLLYDDELPGHHRKLADWLQRSASAGRIYRLSALAFHLAGASDDEGLMRVVEPRFLAEKVRRLGYAVLEDVELLARSMLRRGDPALVERCVHLVEGLRTVAGGDIIEQARHSLRSFRPGPSSFRSRVLAPSLPATPGFEIYVGLLPKGEVGADFYEVVPRADGTLVLALGDAPGSGLKSAFVARFMGNLLRNKTEAPAHELVDVMQEMEAFIAEHPFFETLSLQVVSVDRDQGIATIVNGGMPFPVRYNFAGGRCDRLPVGGELLGSRLDATKVPHYDARRTEMLSGDVLVLVSDGLTEGRGSGEGRFRYRFMPLIKEHAGRSAMAIGEAILGEWRSHPREEDVADDVTVVVVRVSRNP
jgi:serine/threonine protein phosphatase PrpC